MGGNENGLYVNDFEVMNWSYTAQNVDWLWALVTTVMNSEVT
jgi:hypothetical protein